MDSSARKRGDLNRSNDSSHTDLSDIGLCSINRNERHFNILLCYIKMRKFWKAKRMLKKLVNGCPEKYARDILKIGKILREWTNESNT